MAATERFMDDATRFEPSGNSPTMKGWKFSEYGNAPVLQEMLKPSPGPGEVVIDVKASGVCHSDVGMIAGVIDTNPRVKPIVLGHEIAGVVAELGAGVTDFEVGDRVGVFQLHDGHGDTSDGGYAEFVLSTTAALVRMPDSADFPRAAAGTDAGMTSHHAVVTVGGAAPGVRMGIIGLGGLGLTGARIAHLKGAEVFAVEPRESARQRGLEAGVSHVFDDVSGFAGLDLDVIVDFAGFGSTTAGAVEAVRRGGTVVQVGLGASEATINTLTLTLGEVHLVGSFGGDEKDIAAVYELFASGALETPVVTFALEQLPEALDLVEAQTAEGRVVIVQD